MKDKAFTIQTGEEYGQTFAGPIIRNLKILVWREGYEPLPRTDRDFVEWVKAQENLVSEHWPWLLEEMVHVASGAGVKYEDILLLNLRAWQYAYYGAKPQMGGCSSLAITLADGTVASAGALDDPAEYYCGPIRFRPETGHTFITFPLTGTSWGSRGMNGRGLSIGVSSQILPGLRRMDHAVSQDLAVRAILQTCQTTDEVREFCREHPFTTNLVTVDARGHIFCAQHTAAGLLELPAEGFCALTNHVADDRHIHWLMEHGVQEFPELPTTRLRRGNILDFAHRRSGRCTAAEVRDFIAKRDDSNLASVHNVGTIVLTFSNPQTDPKTFWVRQPQGREGGDDYQPLEVD